MPLHVPRFVLYVSTIPWFGLPMRIVTQLWEGAALRWKFDGMDSSMYIESRTVVEQVFVVVFAVLVLGTTVAMAWTIWTLNTIPELGIRVKVYVFYLVHLFIEAWYSIPGINTGRYPKMVMRMTLWRNYSLATLFAVAAFLYAIAWAKCQPWMSSAALGGTGVEPMTLTISLNGPRYQSLGDEPRNGAIRLE